MLLRGNQNEWSNHLKRFGMIEDEELKKLVEEATKILEEEEEHVRRMGKRWFSRFQKKVFPYRLTYILDAVLATVEAGPQLVTVGAETNDLLNRVLPQTPARLPFGPDAKYVPLSGSIMKVKNAQEDAAGPRVVTVHGGPGTGKSSLVKYLALNYYQRPRQQEINSLASWSETLCFPDGVFYLLCGKGAHVRVKQLQRELLESLGFGAKSPDQPDELTTSSEQERECVHQPAYQTKLRFCLVEQKLLIILDDLWETEVLKELLVPGIGLKYLVTSQIRAIWRDVEMIELTRPSEEEARKIMANYT